MSILRSRYLFAAIFVFSLLVFLLHCAFTKTAVFADARFYFAYTHSLVKDHDLNLMNEYFSLNIQNKFEPGMIVANPYPPGVSIFWIPLYLNTNALADIFGFKNLGYEFAFQLSSALTNIFLGIFGLYLVYMLLKKYFSEKVALFSTATLFGATNLLFYIAVEPINSHAASFFVSSLFVFYFLQVNTKDEKDYYLALGLLAGIAGLVRTQDIALLILPAIQIFTNFKKRIKKLATQYLLLTSGFIAGFLPQIILWKYFYNTFWFSPYLDTGFNFLKPQILHVLFNSQNGLFTITPIVTISLIGTFLLKQKDSSLFSYILIYFLLQLYLISAWNSEQGGSYSIRMMVTTYPLISFGLARVFDKVLGKIKEYYALAGVSLLIFLNCALIINYLLKF
jgi:hypothetical protein